ncbi:hypothetical protein [Anaerococcus tetradius]|uniref:hypothetical protein n=1 Tax=Anaerococcus tetradius TaxID=33036 RepID=UPI0023F4C225|nr:hypothetical protein [Anaerococcus tetradius]
MKFFNIRVFNKKKIGIFLFFLLLINFISFTSYPIGDVFDRRLLQSPWTESVMVNMGTASFLNAVYVFVFSGFIYADAFVIDNNTGLTNIIASKLDYKKYIRRTLLYNFVIAGIFAMLPALVNLLLWFTVRADVPLVYFNIMNIGRSDLFAYVFLKSKLVFYILHFIKVFLCGGLIATFAIFINTKFNNRFLGIMIPYILDLIIFVCGGFLDTNSQIGIFRLLYSIVKPDYMTLFVSIVFLVPSIIYFVKYIGRGDLL